MGLIRVSATRAECSYEKCTHQEVAGGLFYVLFNHLKETQLGELY